jgi:hypothetical protein
MAEKLLFVYTQKTFMITFNRNELVEIQPVIWGRTRKSARENLKYVKMLCYFVIKV